ncbi:thrombospondin type 3 repeat-containing protein [Oceanicoccus sp. KOV_DT_Chl]|uniref:thrombospondin type 3 repeat-containing protein n=1 Tax=Oceanicoccus sp. KOV_DT_Chl TaxID=1904639 RepID=UPI000C7CE063|nr:thrombospondin type 3 repeat-containing protein [Oceanicoccus sp. KOV_DT_Chl]
MRNFLVKFQLLCCLVSPLSWADDEVLSSSYNQADKTYTITANRPLSSPEYFIETRRKNRPEDEYTAWAVIPTSKLNGDSYTTSSLPAIGQFRLTRQRFFLLDSNSFFSRRVYATSAIFTANTLDDDLDGVPYDFDNCPATSNPSQSNIDEDLMGDACDSDIDGDGLENISDNCPSMLNPLQENFDGDGVGDHCDSDDDGDHIEDEEDNCLYLNNPSQFNFDGDTQGDACDSDDDNDGIGDDVDTLPRNSVHPVFRASGDDPAYTESGDSTYVGITAGIFSVGKDGSANYRVPIKVPPGINGIQPNLSLSFNHSMGNGIVGQSWALSGNSVISRCNATILRDGYNSNVAGTYYKFCLDGQRLVEVAAGVYRTERQTKLRIKAYNDPKISSSAYWTVEHPDGKTYRYGNRADSTLKFNTTASELGMSWYLDEVSDAAGNTMTYHYNYDRADGVILLSSINYTSNAVLTGTNRRVDFDYDPRPDTSVRYLGGARFQQLHRLAGIRVYNNEALVRRYQLGYQSWINSLYNPLSTSRLTSIREIYPDGSEAEPLEFQWTTITDQAAPFSYAGGGDAYASRTGDIDNDGDLDTVGWDYNYTVNGSDISIPYKKNLTHPWSSSGITKTLYSTLNPILMDINHDGWLDLVATDTRHYGGVDVHLNDQSGQFNYTASPSYSIAANETAFYATIGYGDVAGYLSYQIYFIDMTGDGLVDILRVPPTCPYYCSFTSGERTDISVAINNGAGFSVFEKWLDSYAFQALQDSNSISIGDVNGDRLPDIVAYNGAVALNRGSKFLGGFEVQPHWATDANWWLGDSNIEPNHDAKLLRKYLVDLNSDGLTDLMQFRADGIWVSYSNGLTFEASKRISTYSGCASAVECAVGDFNRDGYMDLLSFYDPVMLTIAGEGVVTQIDTNFNAAMMVTTAQNLVAFDRDLDGDIDISGYVSNFPSIHLEKIIEHSSRQIDISYGHLPSRSTAFHTFYDEGAYDQYNYQDNAFSELTESSNYHAIGDGSIGGAVTLKSVASPKPQNKFVVASTISTDLSVSASHYQTYFYENLRYSPGLWGSLGFGRVTRTDYLTSDYSISAPRRETVSNYRQNHGSNYSFSGVLANQTVRVTVNSGEALTTAQTINNHWEVRTLNDDIDGVGIPSPHYELYKAKELDTGYINSAEIRGREISLRPSGDTCLDVTDNQPKVYPAGDACDDVLDVYGNPSFKKLEVGTSAERGNSESILSVSTLSYNNINTVSRWVIGLIDNETITYGHDLQEKITRETSWEYDGKGWLKESIQEPSQSDYTYTTTYSDFNGYGNATTITESWLNKSNDGLHFNSKTTGIQENWYTDGRHRVTTTLNVDNLIGG